LTWFARPLAAGKAARNNGRMSVPRFFAPELSGQTVALAGTESRHAAGSRRLRTGDAVELFDGRGAVARGRITATRRDRVAVELLERRQEPPPAGVRLTVAAAPAKGPRQDLLIEKLTELGAAAYWPTVFERSVVRPRSGAVEGWRRRAIEAAKQCRRNWLPEFASPCHLADVVGRRGEFDQAWLCHPDGPAAGPRCTGGSVLAVIGPEGGLAPAEIDTATAAGFEPLRLATHVLRVETAAVAVAAIIAAHNVSESR